MKRKLLYLAVVLALVSFPVAIGQQDGGRRIAPPAVQRHATVAAMVASGRADGSIHQTAGYSTAGVGAGTYIYHRTGRPTADGGFYHNGPQADDYYELVNKSVADAKQFGATGDVGDTDDLARLQACVDAGIAAKVPIHITASSGDYDISAPLFATGTASKTSAATFYSAIISGGGMGKDGTEAYTRIVPSFVDRPAIAINLARRVEISDLAIVGTNIAPLTADDTQDPTYANYVTGGQRDSRYSPQCAIAIDPTVGTTPADGGYPSMTYIGNTTSGSNDVVLRKVRIDSHVVGVVYRPDGQSNQVDLVDFDNCRFRSCATAIAPCNTQSRFSSPVSHCDFNSAHTAIDCLRYGAQSGRCPNVNSSQFVRNFRLVRQAHAFGVVYFRGCYGENLGEIGILGTSTATTKDAVVFEGCEFDFAYTNRRPPLIAQIGLPTTFVGCSFHTSGAVNGADVWNFSGTHVSFIGCGFKGEAPGKFFGLLRDYAGRSIFQSCTKRSASGDVRSIGFPLGGAARNAEGDRLEPERNSSRLLTTAAGTDFYVPGDLDGTVNATVSAISLVGSALTFTASDITLFQVGDYLIGTATPTDGGALNIPCFKVTAINGSDVTATTICDSTYVVAPSTPIRICIQEWAPAIPLTGDTNSNTSITNVSPTTILAVGDWIKGTGIPTNARVTVIAGSTVTINKNATATAAGVSLYFGRLHTFTTTAAF